MQAVLSQLLNDALSSRSVCTRAMSWFHADEVCAVLGRCPEHMPAVKYSEGLLGLTGHSLRH